VICVEEEVEEVEEMDENDKFDEIIDFSIPSVACEGSAVDSGGAEGRGAGEGKGVLEVREEEEGKEEDNEAEFFAFLSLFLLSFSLPPPTTISSLLASFDIAVALSAVR